MDLVDIEQTSIGEVSRKNPTMKRNLEVCLILEESGQQKQTLISRICKYINGLYCFTYFTKNHLRSVLFPMQILSYKTVEKNTKSLS